MAAGLASFAGGLFPDLKLPAPAPPVPSPPRRPQPPPPPLPLRPPAHSKAPIHESFTAGGVTLRVLFRRKRVRNMNFRLKGTDLHVSAPLGACAVAINKAIEEVAPKLLQRAARGGHGPRGEGVDEDRALLEEAARIASRFPTPPVVDSVLYTDRQTSCWGTYTRATRSIRLSAIVRFMPQWVRETVIAHELAHAVHFDHSPAFWDLLHRVAPDTERAREFLAGVQWSAEALRSSPEAAKALRLRAGLSNEE
jgi:predicted metal-dependent hydrolase